MVFFRLVFVFKALRLGMMGKGLPFNSLAISFEYPLAFSRLSSVFSSFSSRDELSSRCSAEPGSYSVDNCGFHNAHDGYDRFRKMGPKVSGNRSVFGCPEGESGDNQGSNFGDDEVEESDSSDDGGDISDGNDDFMMLNSFNRNGDQKDVSRFDRDEEEFRHPLVREISRLIELRSAWNPKLEGELRHLLRSLNPRQV